MRKAALIFSVIECIGYTLYGIFYLAAGQVVYDYYYGSHREPYNAFVWILFIVFTVVRFVILGKRESWIDNDRKGLAGTLTFLFIGIIGGILTWCIPYEISYKTSSYSRSNIYNGYSSNSSSSYVNTSSNSSSWKCSACGKIQFGIYSCTECGAKRIKNSANKPNSYHVPMKPSTDGNYLICPLCGLTNDKTQKSCTRCGLQFKEIVNDNNNKETPVSVSNNDDSDDKFMEIKRYKNLLDEGIISEEEFNKKKSEILGL